MRQKEETMGMYVSQLHTVPTKKYKYYVYMVDAGWVRNNIDSITHTSVMEEVFDELRKKSTQSTLVISGPAELSEQIYEFFYQHAEKDFDKIEELFHKVSLLIISNGDLQNTTSQIYVVPLA